MRDPDNPTTGYTYIDVDILHASGSHELGGIKIDDEGAMHRTEIRALHPWPSS